ncbi:hypothetical protein AADZ84_00475 [Colwelliaceae bacterium MEBiC 14330]
MSSQQKILSNDCYQKAFNDSNTALTIATLCLNKTDVYIVDVTKFKRACDELAKVMIKHNKKERLLDFYFWVRAKLAKLFSKETTRLGVRMNCHVIANDIDIIIKDLCRELNGEMVTPLLLNFAYHSCKQQTRQLD